MQLWQPAVFLSVLRYLGSFVVKKAVSFLCNVLYYSCISDICNLQAWSQRLDLPKDKATELGMLSSGAGLSARLLERLHKLVPLVQGMAHRSVFVPASVLIVGVGTGSPTGHRSLSCYAFLQWLSSL